MTDEIKKNELNEEQLEGVAGGGGFSTYSSGKTPKFSKGQYVYYDDWCNHLLGVVKEVSKEKSGWLCEEFTYTVILIDESDQNLDLEEFEKLDREVLYNVWENNLKPA